MLNEWEILQCKLILRKKIQKGGAWIISEGEVVLIHTIVSKTRKSLDPSTSVY